MSAHPILAAVDFSGSSEHALVYAARLGDCFQSPLAVLHVVHDPAAMPGYYAKLRKKKQLHRMEELASDMLNDFLARVRKGHPHLKALRKPRSMLVTGIPAGRIVEVAEQLGARTIVLGSRGHSGLAKLFLGSTALEVVQTAPTPVTVVKEDRP